MPFATRDDVRLYYTDSGRGDPPLLFVHGWCCDHTHWQYQVPAFRRRHRVVAVDLRGHGRSSKPRQEYTIEGFCRDLEWLIGELGLRRPVVVGHSMGGVIAFHLGARARRAYSGVVVVDAPLFPRFTRQGRRELEAIMTALEGPHYIDVAQRTIADGSFLSAWPKQLRDLVHQGIARTPQHVLVSAYRGIWIDNERAARALKVPTLVVDAGVRDLRELEPVRSIPSAQIGVTVGAGHFLQLEAPDQFNPMLRTFVDRLGART